MHPIRLHRSSLVVPGGLPVADRVIGDALTVVSGRRQTAIRLRTVVSRAEKLAEQELGVVTLLR
ncbi:MAG: hypothetical protein WAK86_03630 [Pseudonocardiaceae bacterium]